MASYQRMVSYLYEYYGGEKGGNVGYAKLEIREDIAKMILSIRLRRDVTGVCPVEFYYHEGRQAYRIPAGEVRLTGGRSEDRILLAGASIGLRSLPVVQMSGFRILLPDGMIGSAWDDRRVPVTCEQEAEREPESETERFPETEWAPEMKREQEVERELQMMEVLAEEVMPVMPETPMLEVVPELPESQPSVAAPHSAADIPPFTPDYFFRKGTRMCPFEDGDVTNCVRMEPADLEYFPRETWVLASNSFLLHGYYTYGHLILAQMKGMGRESTILGVPGLNQNRERFLARLFGFEYFKPVSRSGVEEGEFGYWYMHLPKM